MPEFLKALVVILAISGAVYLLFFKTMIAFGVQRDLLIVRGVAYFSMVTAVFLSGNFWLAMAVVGIVGYFAAKRERNPAALYMLLLFGLPTVSEAIPGLGLFGHLFQINHGRLLSGLILLPAAIAIYRMPRGSQIPFHISEKLQLAYFGLVFFLTLDAGTLLGVVRVAVVYPFFDVFLLTYVAARTLDSTEKLWDFLGTFLLGALMLSAVAIFEATRNWLLYAMLNEHLLGYSARFTTYLMRDETLLRAMASTDHSLILGYVLMVGVLIAVGSMGRIRFTHFSVVLALLIAGGAATVSRGPWLGAVVGATTLLLFSEQRQRIILGMILILVLAVPVMVYTESGGSVLKYLPFVGDVETGSLDYRQQLLEVAIRVIADSPFFGAYDFLMRPEMETMRQGQGIIDIVNSYIAVALYSGLVGLFLFTGGFLAALTFLLQLGVSQRIKDQDVKLIAQTLFACFIAILLTIYTVSSIGVIPHIYWILLGTAIACSNLSRRVKAH